MATKKAAKKAAKRQVKKAAKSTARRAARPGPSGTVVPGSGSQNTVIEQASVPVTPAPGTPLRSSRRP